MVTNVLLVDDQEVFRLGLRTLLEARTGYVVVAEAGSGDEGVAKALHYRPDIILMDVRMPGKGGIEACREILAQLPTAKVMMLSAYAEDEKLLEAIEAGAAGYVLKEVDIGVLVRAIDDVVRGDGSLSSSLVMRLFKEIRSRILPAPAVPAFVPMTLKQLVDFLAEHFNLDEMREVCFQLDIEEQTGSTVRGVARAIVQYAKRHGRLAELQTLIRQLRPNVK